MTSEVYRGHCQKWQYDSIQNFCESLYTSGTMNGIRSFVLLTGLVVIGAIYMLRHGSMRTQSTVGLSTDVSMSPSLSPTPNPLATSALRARRYDADPPHIEQTLIHDSAYTKYLVSYTSDGLKIYGVMAVPVGEAPPGGWPYIMLNHGFIPPAEYDNTAKYVAYIDTLARGGFVVFMSDYRGHGASAGTAEGGYFSPGYTIDVMHAISAVKKMKAVNPSKLFLWGHSMGGNVSMRVRSLEPTVKGTVLWAGVVGSYPMIYKEFFNRPRNSEGSPEQRLRWSSSRLRMIREHGTPSASLSYWKSIDPMTTVADIFTPIQIHHGENDQTVPVTVGKLFAAELADAKVAHELYLYPSEDHNINGPSFGTAMARTIEFFRAQMK